MSPGRIQNLTVVRLMDLNPNRYLPLSSKEVPAKPVNRMSKKLKTSTATTLFVQSPGYYPCTSVV